VHPAETADVCALDGRAVATHVMDWLTLRQWPSAVAPIEVSAPIAWAAHSSAGITLRVTEFVIGSIELRGETGVLHRTKHQEWTPNRAIHLPNVPATRAALVR